MNSIDVLVFAAHPDDAEIGCGGTIIKCSEQGRRVVVVDFVRGELGTRGNAETRQRESEAASHMLGLHARENLGLVDGDIRNTLNAKRQVADAVRRWRPRAAFLPYWIDRHPDHANASCLAYDGTFLAGLPRFETGNPPFRPSRVYYYMGWEAFDPTFIVDVSDQARRKMEAIHAYSTQFRPEGWDGPQTRLTQPSTDRRIRSRMAYYGSLIDRSYGEGFLIRGRLAVEDPLTLSFSSF